MTKHNINGVLLQKMPLQQISNIVKYRQFILETVEDITIRFECSQNMCTMIDNFDVGDTISVRFRIEKENVLLCDFAKHI